MLRGEIFQPVSELLGIICRLLLFLILWNRFMPLFSKTDKADKRESVYLAVILILADIFRWYIDENGYPSWIIFLCGSASTYAMIRRRAYIRETLFTVGLFINLRYLSYFIVNSVISKISKSIITGSDQSADILTAQRTMIIYGIAEVLYIIVLLLEIIPFIRFVRIHEKIRWMELCYLSVLNVAGILLTRIIIGIAVLDTADGTIVLLDEKPFLSWVLPFVALLLYLGELSAIIIWQKYSLYRQKNEMLFVRSLEEEAIRRRLNDTEQYYEQIRKVRHEIANHMTNIKGLADQGLLVELSQYISDFNSNVRSVEIQYATGNPVTDVVINDRYRKAADMGIILTLSFVFDESWGISVYDLSIVLSNILDNAINAAASLEDPLKYITLRTIDRGNVILLICENGYDPGAKPVNNDNDFWHGIGLKNVEDIAEKYNGTMNINKDEKTFKITVLLKKKDLPLQ